MPMAIIDDIFQPIYGKPCWEVRHLGSTLTVEFGEPHLEIRETGKASRGASEGVRKVAARRKVFVRGEWILQSWMGDWRILSRSKECANQDSSGRVISTATEELEGQALAAVSMKKNLGLKLKFDLGGMLEIIPDPKSNGMSSDQWILFEASGYCFAMRGDGYYCHMPADTHPKEQVWLPLNTRS